MTRMWLDNFRVWSQSVAGLTKPGTELNRIFSVKLYVLTHYLFLNYLQLGVMFIILVPLRTCF